MLDNNKTGGPAFPCDLTMYDKEVQVQMQVQVQVNISQSL
jgi:hypothetical protein